jgi:hypothetical protein
MREIKYLKIFDSFTIIYCMVKTILCLCLLDFLVCYKAVCVFSSEQVFDTFIALDASKDLLEDSKEQEKTEKESKSTDINLFANFFSRREHVEFPFNFKRILFYKSNHILTLFIPPPNL